jgi:glucose-6-phosphate dehydrogenase assembly protein OpcA
MSAPNPEQILRELNEQWALLAKEHAGTGGVLRACSMTLLVTAGDRGDTLHRTLDELAESHPSRAIVLRLAERAQETMSAYAFAKCLKPDGHEEPICSDGVDITAPRDKLDDVARFLIPLRVPDLPLAFWCRGIAPYESAPLQPLFPLADKAIFDTSAAGDARQAMRVLRELRQQGLRVADLHWTRLTGWREVLAHLVDDGAVDPGAIGSARIGYGGAAVSTCALYFDAWMRTALPGVPVTVDASDGPRGIHTVTLAAGSDRLTLTRDGDCLHVEGCGRNYRTALPSTSEEALMREELGILGADPVYDRVLGI